MKAIGASKGEVSTKRFHNILLANPIAVSLLWGLAGAVAVMPGIAYADSPPAAPCENNIVLDGGFELGHPNPHWAEFFDPGFTEQLITNDSLLAHSGDWFANLGGSAEGDDLMLQQEGLILPYGASATLRFQLRVFPDWFSAPLVVKLDDSVVYTLNPADSEPYWAGYAPVVVDLSYLADGVSRALSFSTWAAGGYTPAVYIDDVCLDVIGPETCPLNSLWSQPPMGALPWTSDAQSDRALA
ncbi:MAG TPA: hypothetical protein PKL84_00790, partial [Candidatus Hydrogenedentes bacterium]|nr:hypothetical protein [Candidatus Hydrogenedentota bacterium]